MATNEQALAAVYSEGKTISVYDSASSAWLDLPGLMDFTESAGERTGRTAGTDSTLPTGVVSNMQAPTVEATFKYVSSPNWDVVDSAFVNKTLLSFRFDTEGETIRESSLSDNRQVVITNSGAVTFATGTGEVPTVDELPLGADIVVGSNHHPIRSVTTSGGVVTAAVVSNPPSTTTTASFAVVTPSERVSFRGKVLMVPTRQHGVAQQSEREGTLTIQCRGILPKPVRIT